jgi:hypothetical protein
MTRSENTEQNLSAPAAPSQQTSQLVLPEDRSKPSESGSARWREIVSTVVELAGLGALSAGVWLIRRWGGPIVLRVGLIVFGVASSPRFAKPRPKQ